MIPVCQPVKARKQRKYVMDCIDTNWISSNGKYIKLFEDKFAEFCETKYAVSTSNGTSALHLALLALGIGKGDEVIVPECTMIASANAVIYTGAKPVFVDADETTWNIDINKIPEKITDKTKAIMVVHTYGNPVDMDEINDIAHTYGLYVIEDAAQAHGATYKGRKIGNLGDVACFSFYGNKIISSGEGGMVVTNTERIYDQCKLLKNHGFTEPRFVHYQLGFNYRMTNIQAAIGLAQLEEAKVLIRQRVDNAKYYTELIRKNKLPLSTPPENEYGTNVNWMYGIVLNTKRKDTIMVKLKDKGIDTRSFFFPMSRQPVFQKMEYLNLPEEYYCPVASRLWKHGLYLPSGGTLTKKQIREVVTALKEVLS